MNKTWIPRLTMALAVGGLLYPTPGATQESPTPKKASKVRITRGPEIERLDPDFAIVRWTSTNPGGSPVHQGVVHYGTHPHDLSQTAQSPIRLNPDHPYVVFRVRLDGLRPRTTYYYRVDSTEADGTGDGLKSPVRHFTTR
jgi:hypothetical protein